MTEKIKKTDAEWRAELTPEQYRIARQKGTEMAFTGEYYKTKTPGTYLCMACGQDCSALTPSTSPAAAGQASINPSTKRQSSGSTTAPME